jgi:RHH-type transcriptional regulator, proline utilization regulon repressor / proline dehydrogenase / delta 1-pyrroline-5-carboxylate dehydrogenase
MKINHRYPDEYQTVEALIAALPWDPARADRVARRTTEILQAVKATRPKLGEIESFLQQYGLNTDEGVALVCLAEALLRIPDAATANELIRDKITAVNWLEGKVETGDLLVRAARYGLSFTKSTLDSVVGNLSQPLIRQAVIQGVRRMGRQFVLGETIDEAVKNAAHEMGQGYAFSFDMLGEGARTQSMADKYMASYLHALEVLGVARAKGDLANLRTGISVKLSALHPRYSPLQAATCVPVLTERLLHLCQAAARHNLTLTVDAEEVERLELSFDIIGAVAAHTSLRDWDGFGLAVQAYQKYAPELVDQVIALAHTSKRRLRVRLVKGAYWDFEAKRAQILGLPDYPLYTRKANTDVSYLLCAHKLLAAPDSIFPMFATHNAQTLAAILEMAGDNRNFECQRLQGMGGPLHEVTRTTFQVPSTIYAPVGTHEDLLAYLVRRLLENGANTSFLNKMNKAVDDPALIADPVHLARAHDTRRHAALPPPPELYGPGRRNAQGGDLAQTDERNQILGPAFPLSAAPGQTTHIEAEVARAVTAFKSWAATDVTARADIIRKFADVLEGQTPRFMRLLQAEGFKTLHDALAEIREAVDFARYYAAEAQRHFPAEGIVLPGPTGESNHLYCQGRGAFVCISPWNFPLAIFTGQVVAALVAGNTVLAKPAEQTPRVAQAAVELLYAAGVPQDALRLVIGDGTAGASLVAYPNIAGVAFTGSVEVARLINRALAAKDGPIVPLIAETGGQNAMIVDSSALLEQVCDDVILSAFGSAGQRCSALRVLFVQNDIADRLIELLSGAMSQLRVGDPTDLATDVGPVIDAEAEARLRAHLDFLSRIGARELARAPLTPPLDDSRPYIAPALFEIRELADLPGEVFGPILHLIRYRSDDLAQVVQAINQTGYGLTFGVQTRLDTRLASLVADISAGNIYINRSMIGAVVGVQPFGGHGLSGTGPKAGGPHYLLRFVHERTVTRNTAASGGNIALVAGGEV